MASLKSDFSQWDAVFDKLTGEGKESLARRMGVEGGVIMRDEAKLRAPVSDPPYNPRSAGSQKPGTLRDSIYLAFDDAKSNREIFAYKVTWNNSIAFWGKYAEFGWTQKYQIDVTSDGYFYTNKSKPLATPKIHPAKPFLAPAFDAALGRIKAAMLARGRVELPILLGGGK